MKSSLARAFALTLIVIPGAACLAVGYGQPRSSSQSSNSDKPALAEESDNYDVNVTTMTIVRNARGASERVVANDSSDAKQIGRVRAALRRQADNVAAGNFPTPARARSNDTPGLAALQAAAPGQVHAQFFEVRAGAEIRYEADDSGLVAALNQWLGAELEARNSATAGTAH